MGTQKERTKCPSCGNDRMYTLYYLPGDDIADAICSDCMGEAGADLETHTIQLHCGGELTPVWSFLVNC